MASGGGDSAHSDSGTSVGAALALILTFGAAYLLAHFVVNRLQRRFLFIAGFEYILLGVLLGPGIGNTLPVLDNLTRLAPIIAFAAGWVALLYGMEFKLSHLLDGGRDAATRIAVVDVLGTGTAVGLASFAFFRAGWLFDPQPLAEAACAASMLACAAAAGSSSAVDLITESYPDLPSRLLPTLRQASRFGDLLSILGLGLVFCIFREQHHVISFAPDVSFWILATGVLGLGLGVLFGIFLGKDATPNSRFLVLVGITVFAAGASFFIEVSALTVNLLLGMYLVNTNDGPAVSETLETSLKPITLVLMVFAGAMWEPVPVVVGLVMAAGYQAVRFAGKATSHFLGSLSTPLRRDVFRGMMAQGDVTLAIAVSFRLVYGGLAADLAFTAVLVSVMVNQLIAPRMLKQLLIDAGELDSDAPALRRAS